jgi:hypothetical protein
MKRYRFTRLYVPKMEESTGEMDALSYAQLCCKLNEWNAATMTRGLWVYWTDDYTGRLV